MAIIIDIDGVLLDYTGHASDFLERVHHIKITRDWSHFYLGEVLGIPAEEAKKLQREHTEQSDFNRIPPLDGAQQGIIELARSNRLVLATYRDERLRKQTLENVDLYFPEVFNQIYFCHDPKYPRDGSLSKPEVAVLENAGIAVEDGPQFIEGYAKEGIHVIAIKQEWNRMFWDKENPVYIEHKFIHPADWPEIPEKVCELDRLLRQG